MTDCILCSQPMGDEQSLTFQPTHQMCGYRSVTGGIGHHLDHAHFCITKGDPDAGLDFHTSALLVWALVHSPTHHQREEQPGV